MVSDPSSFSPKEEELDSRENAVVFFFSSGSTWQRVIQQCPSPTCCCGIFVADDMNEWDPSL